MNVVIGKVSFILHLGILHIFPNVWAEVLALPGNKNTADIKSLQPETPETYTSEK